MNDLFKKAMQAGLGLAVVTTEKVKDIVEDLVEKGKKYQDKAEAQEVEDQVAEGEAAEDAAESKNNRFEDIEQRVRKLIENAIARFNFIKSDEHDRIEQRIEKLEERLNKLVSENIETKAETSERI